MQEPYEFSPYHVAIREPFNYYLFGQNYIRPLISFRLVNNLCVYYHYCIQLFFGLFQWAPNHSHIWLSGNLMWVTPPFSVKWKNSSSRCLVFTHIYTLYDFHSYFFLIFIFMLTPSGWKCDFDLQPPIRSRSSCYCIAAWNNKSPYFWEHSKPAIDWNHMSKMFPWVKYLSTVMQIYVAGDRVITDPLCKPFSMGRFWYTFIWHHSSTFFNICRNINFYTIGICCAYIQKNIWMMFLSLLRWKGDQIQEV